MLRACYSETDWSLKHCLLERRIEAVKPSKCICFLYDLSNAHGTLEHNSVAVTASSGPDLRSHADLSSRSTESLSSIIAGIGSVDMDHNALLSAEETVLVWYTKKL